jgi:uncharacterized protein (TIGR00730 family)
VKRVCVFCGSNLGTRAEYVEAAQRLGRTLVERRLGLVYGGGSVGLMGALADAVLERGGEVIGVIPRPLATRELAHRGVTELRVVASMHERKATMAALADGFVALPGGLGTLEETLEILTWAQLGIHEKPVGVLDVHDYYEGLRRLLVHAEVEGFVRREHAALLLFATTPDDLLDRLLAWRPSVIRRAWLSVEWGAPTWPPIPPQRSSRPGGPGALLDSPAGD